MKNDLRSNVFISILINLASVPGFILQHLLFWNVDEVERGPSWLRLGDHNHSLSVTNISVLVPRVSHCSVLPSLHCSVEFPSVWCVPSLHHNDLYLEDFFIYSWLPHLWAEGMSEEAVPLEQRCWFTTPTVYPFGAQNGHLGVNYSVLGRKCLGDRCGRRTIRASLLARK